MWNALFSVDLHRLLVPDVSLLEIFLRGTLIYLGLYVLLRWLRRPTGQLGIADVLLITLLADASQNAMGAGYESFSSGFWLVLTIIFWDQAIDRLSYRWPRLARWTEPPPLRLVTDGRMHHEELKRNHISEQELLAHLREHGVGDIAEVAQCHLENDGQISVLTRRRAPGRKAD